MSGGEGGKKRGASLLSYSLNDRRVGEILVVGGIGNKERWIGIFIFESVSKS